MSLPSTILFCTVMLNFEEIESKKTAYQIAVQSQKVLEKEAETKMKQDTIQAEAARDVALIQVLTERGHHCKSFECTLPNISSK